MTDDSLRSLAASNLSFLGDGRLVLSQLLAHVKYLLLFLILALTKTSRYRRCRLSESPTRDCILSP